MIAVAVTSMYKKNNKLLPTNYPPLEGAGGGLYNYIKQNRNAYKSKHPKLQQIPTTCSK